MNQDELNSLFDQQAEGYDRQWARMAPIRDGLHALLPSVFAPLGDEAQLLCVGAGTGAELSFLAAQFPGWRFTAIDPSAAMLEVCRRRAQAEGFFARCSFHEGYVETLPPGPPHDGATCFLVSQFMTDPQQRAAFFRAIAQRLRPGAILANADLAGDTAAPNFDALLRCWFGVMSTTGMTPEALARMREAYARDVAVLPPGRVAALIASAGFEEPVQFYQAGMMHAWFCRRADGKPAAS